MDRLAMLQQFVAQKPDEPFPRYGLAMEYKKLGRLEEASATFAELIARSPGYVAAYLHAGQTLLARGLAEEARAVFTSGVAAARAAGDDHALGELESARAALA